MKKKLLATVLTMIMVVSLSACGKEPTNEEVTTDTPETTPVVEESVETPTDDGEVEAPVIVTDEATGYEVGETELFEFGTYTVISNENGFSNVEVEYIETCYKATVPQDMGYEFRFKDNYLYSFNEHETKALTTWYGTVTEEDKEYVDALSKDELIALFPSYTYPENGFYEKTWASDSVVKIVFEASFYNEVTEKERQGYVFYAADFDKGIEWNGYYGEYPEICDMKVAKIVADSFEVISKDDMLAKENLHPVDENGGIDGDTLAEYGLTDLDLGYSLENVRITGDYVFANINTLSFEETKALGKKFATVVTLYGWDGKESDGTSLMREDDPIPMDMFYYQVGDKWVNLNISYLNGGAEFQFGYSTPSFAN